MSGPIDLRGRAILISGASSGIGAATAEACAAAGMGVMLMARREERLRAVAERVEGAGGEAGVFAGDVSDAGACGAAVDACVERFGGLYGAFANAGYGFEKSFLETTEEDWRGIFEVNVFGTINLLRPAVRLMLERGEGHAVVCSSSIGKLAVPWYSAYCASKAAQWPIGHALAGELRERGVYSTTVHPIGTRTEFFDRARERSGGAGQVSDNTPGFLMQEPGVVARAIVRALRRPRLEVWPGVAGRLTGVGAGLLTAFPWLASLAGRGVARKKMAGRDLGVGSG